mgnify:FL=1
MLKDTKTFVNPVRGPRYQGSFSIELVEGARVTHVPSSASISNNVITVTCGSVNQAMGGIQFYSELTPFSWGYNFIKCIRKDDGDLIWVNDRHR